MKFLFDITIMNGVPSAYLVSKTFWDAHKTPNKEWLRHEMDSLKHLVDQLSLVKITDNWYQSSDVDISMDDFKAHLLKAGLEESEELTKYLIEQREGKEAPEEEKETEKPLTPQLAHTVEFVGSDSSIQMGIFDLLPLIKKTYPKALLHSLSAAGFKDNCHKWDDVSYLFQDQENFEKFSERYIKTLPRPDVDIYVSDEGDVAFDLIAMNQRRQTEYAQAVAAANKAGARAQVEQNKHDRKINAKVEIKCSNQANYVKRFMVRGIYTDSRGRGQIDIDLDNDINKDDIAALLAWVNDEGEQLNDIELEGPAYTVTNKFFYTHSIGRFCADQLHASVLDTMIKEFEGYRNGIKMPTAPTR